MMKKNCILFSLLLFVLSCNKSEEPTIESYGVIEEFLLQDSEIIKESINTSNLDYTLTA